MAGIDKTYISTYQQYREIADWCKAQGVVQWRNNTFKPYDWIPHIAEYDEENDRWIDHGEWTEEYFNECVQSVIQSRTGLKEQKYYHNYVNEDEFPTLEDWIKEVDSWEVEICLWNTPIAFDVYLIQNCPVQLIQNRLKEQYRSEYESIRNRTSRYDTFVRDYRKNPKFTIEKRDNRIKREDMRWWIRIENFYDAIYDNEEDQWYFDEDCHIPRESADCSFSCVVLGQMSERRIYRLIRRWELPTGTKLTFEGEYDGYIVKLYHVEVK